MNTDVPPPAPGRGASRARPHRSRRRVWLFRGLTLALVVGLLLLLEGLLHLCGVGESLVLVVPAPGAGEAFNDRLNPLVDRVYFGAFDMHGPEPRRFTVPKPPGIYRIVFLGASTVNGFPYSTEIAFPRQVEVLLEAQRPGTEVEVLNAAITAINSFEIADLARQCRACEPDLVAIHGGHNEFFGPGGPASTALPLPPRLIRLAFAVRRTRIAQAIYALSPSSSTPPRHPLESLPRLTDVRLGDATYRQAAENYRSNLNAALQTLFDAGIPVLLTTVASNLRDQGPIRTLWPAGQTAAEHQQCLADLALAEEAAARGDWQAALNRLDALRPKAEGAAQWEYRRAQALEALNRPVEAREAYRQARDLDGCRFRASTEFGEIVREIAAEHGPERLSFLDLEAAVSAASSAGVPGRELFLEHVHYTLAGHRLLARHLAQHIHAQCLQQRWDPARELTDAECDRQLGLLPEDAVAGDSFTLEVLTTQPLAGALDVDREMQLLRERIQSVYATWPAAQQSAFADLPLSQMQQDLAAGLGAAYLARGDLDRSLSCYRRAAVRRPWSAEAWWSLAQAESRAGHTREAREAVRRTLALQPGWEPAATAWRESDGDFGGSAP